MADLDAAMLGVDEVVRRAGGGAGAGRGVGRLSMIGKFVMSNELVLQEPEVGLLKNESIFIT
ncbi:hypothetical protein [Paracoccus marcusii]|uniref:hypothetical protein n=1 Tax=Paracoccus marcusii TaxID=59779 RepID=UPI003265C594